MTRSATLRLDGHGNVEIQLLGAFLADLDQAYGSILYFERSLERIDRSPFDLSPDEWMLVPYRLRSRTFRAATRISLEREDSRAQIPSRDRLRLARVELASPGFWEIIGNLNPLTVLCQYLDDRHRRRQDREYRESAEERRLELENLILENQVLAGRIQNAKKLGMSDADLAPLIMQLVERPLIKLGVYQDRGVIEGAKISDGTEE